MGPLALKPWEFERLTIKEFTGLVEGWHWRRREKEDLAAWSVCILANASGNLKKKLTIPQLVASFGRKTETQKREKHEVAAEFQALAEEMGAGK